MMQEPAQSRQMEDAAGNPRFGGKMIKCPYCGRIFREGREEPRGNADRTCLVCGHSWRSRDGGIPRRCPACRSLRWNQGEKKLRCAACGYEWTSRIKGMPKKCPRCQSTGWRVPGAGRAEHEMQARENSGPDRIGEALTMYSEGATCVEASIATGIPIETLMKALSKNGSAPVRMKRRERRS